MGLEKNWIKAYIVDILPCIVGLVYILAVVYNIAYFSVFGINVIHYLTLSEMLMSIIEPLIFVVIFNLFWMWLTLISYKINMNLISDTETRIKKWKKNSRICIFLRKLWNSSFVLKIRNFCLFRWIKKTRIKNDRMYERLPLKFLREVLLILVISFCLYLSFLQSVGYESGIYLAALALTIPPFLFISFVYLSFIFDGKNNYFEEIRKVGTTEIVSAVFAYYLFGLVVFYKNGTDSGDYFLQHNQTKFEIRTSDGTMFTNAQYGYVEQLNENIFLFEKKTGEVVILSKSNLNYTKIDFTNTQRGLIPSLAGNIDKLLNLEWFLN